MVLIKSSSGIRGILGGKKENSFSPTEVIKFSSGYIFLIKKKNKKKNNNYKIILGRDGRSSSILFHNLIMVTIQFLGFNVVDIGLSTTPTVGIAIIEEKSDGGIMITASHNKQNWNGLKFFNSNGEFLSEKNFNELLKIVEKNNFNFVSNKNLGKIIYKKCYIQKHINKILSIPIINNNINNLRKYKLRVLVDGINSTGGIAVPILLKKLGIDVIKVNCNIDGNFVHNPEPIKKNLKEICKIVPKVGADFGISVDPDVDRVVFICENGEFFGEEYTLISIVDFILKNESGPVVSTLSSSHALKDICIKNNVKLYYSSIGEANVVKKMKEYNAIIGGEGNGGIIYPKIRYGRDALIGIALLITHLYKLKCTSLYKLKKTYPIYFMSKKTVNLSFNYNFFLKKIKKKYIKNNIDCNDGIKIYFPNNEWIHVRKSKTENIIRIYSESPISNNRSNLLTKEIINEIKKNI
ncbi:phosphohexomutase domain-containing protein [Blattabacterium cuenoti]|uniref:phosphoglucosamine mutase n=1 Tax=Blattabacterium cuenoti TaxID=1653831 RepID=UPI00163C5594|nr:phosphoglucosamine mutase [Blattabacterium cuenoti]